MISNSKNKNKWMAWFQKVGFQLLLAGILVGLLLQKDLNFQLELKSSNAQAADLVEEEESPEAVKATLPMSFGANLIKAIHTKEANESVAQDDNLGNTYSNMTYGKEVKAVATDKVALAKRKRQQAYVKRFAHVAQGEMKKYGIPASITLAQGLIESNAGDSRLSRENNNHFGMKCFSRKCKKGHCTNFTDDSHKDFFRKYQTAWESYRAHSLMLHNSQRYKKLFKLGKQDYKAWAGGLSKAGYATDRRYAQKLVYIIEDLKLDQFDR
ncbi:MAG: glucosaminidase domain-containing protein [Bacteroidota bacterium]